MDAKQTPLIDLLERVPADARMVCEHDKFHSQNIPVGRLCHEAAAALKVALAQQEQKQEQEPVAKMHVVFEDRNGALRRTPADCQARGANGHPAAVYVGRQRYVPEQEPEHRPGCALLQIPSRDCDCRQEAEPTRAQKMRDAGYTRRPTLREMGEQEQKPCKRHNPCERLPDGYCARCHSEMHP